MADLDDLFSEPSGAPARVSGRFRPKAKPRPSQVASKAATSALPDVITEKPVTVATTASDTVPSIKSVDVGFGKVTDPVGSSLATSEILGSIEPSKNNVYISTHVPSSAGNEDTKSFKSTGTAALQPEVAASDGSGDSNSSFGKAAGENADIFSGLECLDAPTHCSAKSSPFMVCDVAEAQTYSDCRTNQDPVSYREISVPNKRGEMQLETKVDGTFSDLEVLDVVSDNAVSSEQSAGKFQPKLKVKKGKENLQVPCSEVESTELSQAAHLAPSGTGDMNQCSLPISPHEHALVHPSPRIGDSRTLNTTSECQLNTENLLETTHSVGTILGDAMPSEDVGGTPGKVGQKSRNVKASAASKLPQKRKSFAASEEGESGTSSRQLRKRLPCQQVDELVHKSNGESLKPSSDFDVDEDEDNDDEYREQKTSQRKRAPRKSKKHVSETEPVPKRKRAKEGSDQSTKDPPKKFRHSTRRNKRHVDKDLLARAEGYIDPQTLTFKDLIRLAEHRELLEIKEGKRLATPRPDESTNDDSHKQSSNNDEETSDRERSSDENKANYKVNTSAALLNYQSYMDKAPTARWSKQDTELFYEAIQQCGSDFNMIFELYFPGRTRHQVKLKFKKEERQHPSRINDALLNRSNRSTDHSQFTSYIEKLKQAARTKKEANGEESVDATGKEEVDMTHDTDEGVTKPESEEPEPGGEEAEDKKADGAQVYNDEVDDGEFSGWSDS